MEKVIMNRFIFIFVLLGILSSCSEDKVKKVTLVSSVSEVSDTLFFAKVENLIESKGYIFFIDEYRNQIVVLNSNDGTLKSLVGVHGEGPNELCNLSQFALKNDTLYVLDGGCAKLVTYDFNGNMGSKYPLPLESKLMTGFRFSISEYGKMDISTRSDSGLFTELNLLDNEMSFWGERHLFNYTSQNVIRNGRNLFQTKEGYVVVSDNIPQIEIYDSKKKKISTYNYSNLTTVGNRLLYIRRENQKSNSYGIVCEDSYVSNDKLYLLIASNDDSSFKVNRIAVFSLYPEIRFDILLEMPGNVYSTFCVSNSEIFAFESQKCRLESFQIR